MLGQLQSINAYERVTVDIKVLKCKDQIQVFGGKTKQDIIVADHRSTAKLTLWEEHIGKLVKNSSYSLKNFQVRENAAIKSLSMETRRLRNFEN